MLWGEKIIHRRGGGDKIIEMLNIYPCRAGSSDADPEPDPPEPLFFHAKDPDPDPFNKITDPELDPDPIFSIENRGSFQFLT